MIALQDRQSSVLIALLASSLPFLASTTMEIDSIAEIAAPTAVEDRLAQPEDVAQNMEGPAEPEEPEASTSASTSTSRAYVQSNDAVLLQLPSETVRLIRLAEQNVINLGRYGSFLSTELVGQPYGATFEVVQPDINSEDNSDAVNDDDDAVIPLAKGKGKGKESTTARGKKNQQVKAKDLCMLKRKDTDSITLEEIIQTDATNELIKATGAKTLSYDEIMDMKKQGVSGQVGLVLHIHLAPQAEHLHPGNHRTPDRRT